jgi:hypothetical protein
MPEQSPSPANNDAAQSGEIDVYALAEKVYQLMMADARLSRVRSEHARGQGPVRQED